MATENSASEVEVVHKTDVDIKNRTVYITGQIDPGTSRRAIESLRLLDSSAGDITIVINTPGGDACEGFAVHDTIRQCVNHVTVLGVGSVMSMGAAVFQAGDWRQISENTRFMVHNGSVSFEGEADRVQSLIKDLRLDNDSYHKILSRRSGLPVSKIRAMCRKETFLTPPETLALGLADEIVYG